MSSKFFIKKGPISTILSVVLSVFFIVGIVEAATTISSNISTGGSLSVTGASTLTGAVTTTAGITSGSDISSDTDSTDSLGTTGTRWASIFSDAFTGNTIALDGATGVNSLTITDGVADALSIIHGATDFMVFDTSTPALTITPNTSIGGTLSVTGASTLTGNVTASGTLGVTGAATITGNSVLTSADVGGGYSSGGSGLTLDTTGKIQTNGDLEINGYATTTAATGNIATEGTLVIGGGTAITQHLSATASLDFPVIAANSCEVLTITVTGAVDGDVVSLGMPNSIASASSTLMFSGWVSAADTVTTRVCQIAATATSDFAAATVRADVWKH